MNKHNLNALITTAINTLSDELKLNHVPAIQIEPTQDANHGDFACNIAMVLAKQAKLPAKQLAQRIVAALPQSPLIAKTDIAGPGFINFTLAETAYHAVIHAILQQTTTFGHRTIANSPRVHIEFVSANPTGPLHVGHGRGAAYGACVANLLKAAGYQVHCEYYVNDAGRQMQILALSIWLRYCQLNGNDMIFPEKIYQGDYIIDIAKSLVDESGSQFSVNKQSITEQLPTDYDASEEIYIDTLIDIAKKIIGEDSFNHIKSKGIDAILSDIKDDLSQFGVSYNAWFCESRLFQDKLIDAGIHQLKKQGHTYERDGALWLRATSLGDDKDRVLIRANGQTTYFASDVAYHLYKYQQGYDQIIDIFGADHHGYIARIKAFLQGLGEDANRLTILMVQFAVLYRHKQKVSMSTRAGEFVTLRALREEVGNDAARYFYIMRKPEQHLDFDLDLAKSQSNENPVYYIQYAHARICSVWRQLQKFQWQWDKAQGQDKLVLLDRDDEKMLMKHLSQFPDLIESCAKNYAPHLLAYYLQTLANHFHSYYNAVKFLVDEPALRDARLCLLAAIQQVIVNGLTLLGLSAPEVM